MTIVSLTHDYYSLPFDIYAIVFVKKKTVTLNFYNYIIKYNFLSTLPLPDDC